MDSFGKNLELVVLYEEELLELKYYAPYRTDISMDTSTPGVVKITSTQSLNKGETALCYLYFTAKEEVTGTAHVAVSPESTFVSSSNTCLFSECTGLLLDVCLPDYNGDSITDLRDFTLLAKQDGVYVDEETEKYDITGNGSVDDKDLDYLKELLFADITEADQRPYRRPDPAGGIHSKNEDRNKGYHL